jgi:transposase-like protein
VIGSWFLMVRRNLRLTEGEEGRKKLTAGEMLVRGESVARIAKSLGVKKAEVARWISELPMERLLEAESKRVMRHMGERGLSKEKYLALSTAVVQMVEKGRLLRNEPTGIIERRGEGVVRRELIAVETALADWEPGRSGRSQRVIEAEAREVGELQGAGGKLGEDGGGPHGGGWDDF